jgi:predicted glutamine amidotransferase
MCRLLATVSAEPKTIEEVLGDDQLREFSELSEFHDDGWGAARVNACGDIQTCSSTSKADVDPAFGQYTKTDASTEHLAHLRWASEGMGNTLENAHPFLQDGFAFMHNGNIAAPADMEQLLDADSLQNIHGSTDSKRFFAYIMQCCRNSGSTENGVIRAVKDMREAFPGRSLNSFVMHDGKVYVINFHAGVQFDLTGYPERRGHTPWLHDKTHYHELMLHRDDEAIVVSSTGIRDGEWEKLPEESIFEISREQGVPSIRTIWEE